MTDPQKTLADAARALDADRAKAAKDLVTPLLLTKPDWVEARFLLARAEAALGQVEAAQAAFDQALLAAPKVGAIWLELALFAHGQGTGEAVIRRARAAELPAPLLQMITEAAQGRGARAHGTGNVPKKAVQALIRAIDAGDHRAAAQAEKGLKGSPGPQLLGLIGRARLLRGAAAEAEAAFRTGLKHVPPPPICAWASPGRWRGRASRSRPWPRPAAPRWRRRPGPTPR